MHHHFSPSLHQSQAPFSHLSVHAGFAYTAGIIGQDRTTGALHPGGVSEQCTLMLDNLGILLAENGLDWSQIIKTTVYLTSYDDFDAVNTEYSRRFQASYPARTTLHVAGLPLGASVQIDAVVAMDSR